MPPIIQISRGQTFLSQKHLPTIRSATSATATFRRVSRPSGLLMVKCPQIEALRKTPQLTARRAILVTIHFEATDRIEAALAAGMVRWVATSPAVLPRKPAAAAEPVWVEGAIDPVGTVTTAIILAAATKAEATEVVTVGAGVIEARGSFPEISNYISRHPNWTRNWIMSALIDSGEMRSCWTRCLSFFITASLGILLLVSPPLAGASPSQEVFKTPEAAAAALVSAARTDDMNKLAAVLGSDSEQILSSGDPVADHNARADFVAKYDEMHRLAYGDRGRVILYIGAGNWPTPIPLVKSDGGWIFDTAAGKEELLYRRVGEMNSIPWASWKNWRTRRMNIGVRRENKAV